MPAFNLNELNLNELESFLADQASTQQWPSMAVSEQDAAANAVVLALTISPDLVFFAGHFPDQPVLPGVVQIHWAGEFAKRLFAVAGFSGLQGAKFNSMVLPGTTVQLSLQYKPDKNSVRFSFFSDDEKFSVGSLHFTEVAA